MKKKSILAILVIALVLTVGLMVSCEPDPDPTDELYGTWVYSYTVGLDTHTIIIDCDGQGKFTLTEKTNSVTDSASNGTYTLSNGYANLVYDTDGMEDPSTTYVFAKVDGSDHYLVEKGNTTLPASTAYDSVPPFDKKGGNIYPLPRVYPITLELDIPTTHVTYQLTENRVNISEADEIKDGDDLLFKSEMQGLADVTWNNSCTWDGSGMPSAYALSYSNTEVTSMKQTVKYSVSGNTLTFYMGGAPIPFTKQ